MSSAAQFTGNVPERYDRYLVPLLFEPYAIDLVARLPERDDLRVLELAAGTGAATRRLPEALAAGSPRCPTDLDEAMVAHAVQQVLDEWSPDDPPRFLDTPYGYGGHDRLRRGLAAAAWEKVELDEVRRTGQSPSAEDTAIGYLTGTPLSFELTERGEDP